MSTQLKILNYVYAVEQSEICLDRKTECILSTQENR